MLNLFSKKIIFLKLSLYFLSKTVFETLKIQKKNYGILVSQHILFLEFRNQQFVCKYGTLEKLPESYLKFRKKKVTIFRIFLAK